MVTSNAPPPTPSLHYRVGLFVFDYFTELLTVSRLYRSLALCRSPRTFPPLGTEALVPIPETRMFWNIMFSAQNLKGFCQKKKCHLHSSISILEVQLSPLRDTTMQRSRKDRSTSVAAFAGRTLVGIAVGRVYTSPLPFCFFPLGLVSGARHWHIRRFASTKHPSFFGNSQPWVDPDSFLLWSLFPF